MSMSSCTVTASPADQRLAGLQHEIEHLAHRLPSQGPITVFVHHNTLHAFEDLPFEQAVRRGWEVYGAQPFLSESRYREEFARGRIRPQDIEAELIDDLGDGADELIGFMGTRFHLRLAVLAHPVCFGSAEELEWHMAETGALRRFHAETPPAYRAAAIRETRHWFASADSAAGSEVLAPFRGHFAQHGKTWSDAQWEAITLELLWSICRSHVDAVPDPAAVQAQPVRHAEFLQRATGQNVDLPVHELLIRFCAAFLDQGFARWGLPRRDAGLWGSFFAVYGRGRPVEPWLVPLPAELQRLAVAGLSPLASIAESLELLGVADHEREEYLQRTLLALGGWAGMLRQMETNAEWTVRPAPHGTLVEFLAVRLILDRLSVAHASAQAGLAAEDLHNLRTRLDINGRDLVRARHVQRAFIVFQLAQVRGWTPVDLLGLGTGGWRRLMAELDTFDDFHRRRIYHRAYERRYRLQALDAIANHRPQRCAASPPRFQLFTCIDDREESFRRHLEELAPECETIGAPGFYAVPIYYQGAADANFRPLCPIVVKPQHWVREDVAYSLTASSRQRSEARRKLGAASHQWHLQSRTFLGGIATALLGSLASIPMVTRILFPRATSGLRRRFGGFLHPPSVTELRLQRVADPCGPEDNHLGFTIPEMAAAVERLLREIGLTRNFARLVLVLGHGSTNLNNPHESAYCCGACSGGRGGPNARAFAQMANHPDVRAWLTQRGLEIPATTVFVGGFHNTCDEDVTFFDLDHIPWSHRGDFEAARDAVDEARGRSAAEKSRRFQSARLDITAAEALEHVQTRAEDLSQVRPEYNHATNALCVVGRRCRTRGLFLDRRAFLNDYDPTQDDDQHTLLARVLGAAIPVCAGISLEYYFSCVDDVVYGSGSKLPHNITSLLGVMEGAASDLRPGLSRQMIEIHEPLRILFVIETTPDGMLSIMERSPAIARLVRNEWVQLAVLDPDSPKLQIFEHGTFVPYIPGCDMLPVVASSRAWYGGRRDHLGFAAIAAHRESAESAHSPQPPGSVAGRESTAV